MYRWLSLVLTVMLAICAACSSGRSESSDATTSATTGITDEMAEETPTTAPTDVARIHVARVSLSVPEMFRQGDLDHDRPIIVERLRSAGPQFDAAADAIESNPDAFLVWLTGTVGEDSVFSYVATDALLSGVTLVQQENSVRRSLPDGQAFRQAASTRTSAGTRRFV